MRRFGRFAFVAALAACATLMLGACSTTRSVSDQADDATISAAVKARLAGDPEVSAHEIDVDTVDGQVTLSGNVDTAAERAEAVELARGAEGVVGVTDNLQVAGGPSAGEMLDDAGLMAKVKAKLADDPMVKARDIDVDVLQGVVTLTGRVQSEAERLRAEQIAQSTSGVKGVTNNLEVAAG